MTKKYYIISDVDKGHSDEPHSSEWPKLIAYSFDGNTILIKEGRGHGLAGGELPISSIDMKTWQQTFHDSGAEWFKNLVDNGSLEKMDEDEFKNELSKRAGVKELLY